MANSNFNSSIGFNIGCSRDTDYDVAVADAFAILLVQLAMVCMMKNRINRLVYKEVLKWRGGNRQNECIRGSGKEIEDGPEKTG